MSAFLVIGSHESVRRKLADLYPTDTGTFVWIWARVAQAAIDPKLWVKVEIHEHGPDFSLRVRAVDPAVFNVEAISKAIE